MQSGDLGKPKMISLVRRVSGWLAFGYATVVLAADLGSEVGTDGHALASARAAFREGDYAKAVALHEQELAARRERFGARHPDVAQVLQNLATLGWGITAREAAELAELAA